MHEGTLDSSTALAHMLAFTARRRACRHECAANSVTQTLLPWCTYNMASRNGSAAVTVSISHSVSTSMESNVDMNQHTLPQRDRLYCGHIFILALLLLLILRLVQPLLAHEQITWPVTAIKYIYVKESAGAQQFTALLQFILQHVTKQHDAAGSASSAQHSSVLLANVRADT
eukprot:2062-Heterococcus_DN1.PRE.5